MHKSKPVDLSAPFQTIANTSRITGISQFAIRQGLRSGSIPFVRGMSGNSAYLVNVPLFLKQLETLSESNMKGGKLNEQK